MSFSKKLSCMRLRIMFKKSVIYLLLNYSLQVVNIALNLLFMRYLNSSQMGSLTLARTWQQLTDYSHLGTRFSLDRYIPVSIDRDRGKMVASVLIFTLLSASILLAIAALSTKGDATVVSLALCGVGISLANIIKCYYRASERISEMLKLVFFCQLIPVVIPLLIYLINSNWNYYLVSSVTCYIFFIVRLLYIERKLFANIDFKTIFNVLSKLASSSVLLFANAIFVFLSLVMDRFFIDNNLGRDMLGAYSVITFAFTALMIIPSTCAELLFVKVVRQSSSDGKKIFFKEVCIILGVTILGVIAANTVMGYFITNFTKYGNFIKEIHLATFGVIPYAFTSIYYHVINGLDMRKQLVFVNGFLCLALSMYYIMPLFKPFQVDLDYYIYAKLATGWFIVAGYILCVLYHQFVIANKIKDVTT